MFKANQKTESYNKAWLNTIRNKTTVSYLSYISQYITEAIINEMLFSVETR